MHVDTWTHSHDVHVKSVFVCIMWCESVIKIDKATQAKLAAVEQNNVQEDEPNNKKEQTTQQVITSPGELNCMYSSNYTHFQLTILMYIYAYLLKKTTVLMT